jgi:hypothetical protein
MNLNILDACLDPRVFGSAFRNRDSWHAWFSFLAALFGLPMEAEQHRVFKECTQRSDRPTQQAQEAWLVCGRRSGKSFMLGLVSVFLAAFRDWTPYLGIGERGTVMVIAADRKQARVIMRYVKGLLHSVPMLKRLIEAERVESIDLANRITIETHTASFRTVRGYSIVAALLDEMAFWPTDENSSSPDFEVVNAIRPAMSTIPDAMLLCASSPYARKGALWESYHRYFGKESPILVWQAPTRTMNPTVLQSHIDAEYEKDPVSAEAEFGAQFRTDIESFISREAVEACVEWGIHERGYLDGIRYVAFTDPSGGSGSDAMTLAIAHKEGEIAVLDCIREVRPPFSPEGVVTEFAEVLKSYKITRVVGDRYAGEWPREQFAKRGIRYEPSKDPKGTLYLNVLPLLNSAKVRLLGEKRLVSQLVGLERNTARGGKDNIDHARGGHDDIANAVAGALLSATAKRSELRIGTIDVDGRVHWKDEDPERPRVRYVVLTEQEDLRRRGLL